MSSITQGAPISRRKILKRAAVAAGAAGGLPLLTKMPQAAAAGPTQAAAAGPSVYVKSGRTTIGWMTFPAGTGATQKRQNAFNESIIKEYKAKTGNNVEVQWAGWDIALNKIVANIATSQGPDVFQMAEQWTGQIFATNAVLDLTAHVEEFGGQQDYFPAAMKYGVLNGHVYGFPWGGDVRSVCYRSDWFEKAGLAAPTDGWRWNDFVRDMQQLKSKGIVKYPFLTVGSNATGAFDVAYAFIDHLLALGGSELDHGWTKAAFNSSLGVQALRDITDLTTKYKIIDPGMAEMGGDQMVAAFLNGSTSAIRVWAAMYTMLEGTPLRDKFGVVVQPHANNGHFGSTVFISVFSVPKYSPNQAAAIDFMKMLMSPKWQAEYNKAVGWLPARRAAFNEPYFKTGWRSMLRVGMEQGEPLAQVPVGATLITILARHIANVYTSIALGKFRDGMIKSELDAAAQQVNSALTKGH